MFSRITNPRSDEYELLGPHGISAGDDGISTIPAKPFARSFSGSSYSEYESLGRPSTSSVHTYNANNFGQNPSFRSQQPQPEYWKSLVHFVRRHSLLLVALAVGVAGSLASFGFAFWLSHEIFDCPAWTVHCDVKNSVRWFISRLGFVQGFLSSLYGISIASIAYATYQLAETTIWPMLTEQPLTLEAIDRYLAHARGSLPSFPMAAWHTRKSKHITVVLIVGVVGILLQASATIVGWAFTIVPVATVLRSNHTIGGGMGFGFYQNNPPAPRPGAPSNALGLYAGWAGTQYEEVLPDLREYLIDRLNFSSIGNFTVPTLRARKSIHCYGESLDVVLKPSDASYLLYAVKTSSDFGGGFMGDAGEVLLRFLPNQLTVWVDSYKTLSDTRAVTKLMFAIVNGTFERGINNQYRNMANNGTESFSTPYPSSGISALACDVDIDLVMDRACNGECRDSRSKALTSLEMTTIDGSNSALSLYLGAVPSVLGPSIYGGQPVFATGTPLPNSSYALPVPFSDVFTTPPPETAETQHWSIANVTNFINVTSGALGIYAAQDWPQGWTLVDSTLDMSRLDPQRSYALLAPPGIALVCVIAVGAMSFLLHRDAGVPTLKLGSTSEILVRSADGEVRSLVDGIRAGYTKPELLEKKLLWFGQLPDGRPGLGASVRPLSESRSSSRTHIHHESVRAKSFV